MRHFVTSLFAGFKEKQVRITGDSQLKLIGERRPITVEKTARDVLQLFASRILTECRAATHSAGQRV